MKDMCSDPSIYSSTEAVPCRLCGRDTRMLGTELCDGCWELETRIEGDVDLAVKIILPILWTRVIRFFTRKRGLDL